MSGKQKANLVTEAKTFKESALMASFYLVVKHTQGDKSLPHCFAVSADMRHPPGSDHLSVED